jgi:hypothetical protein
VHGKVRLRRCTATAGKPAMTNGPLAGRAKTRGGGWPHRRQLEGAISPQHRHLDGSAHRPGHPRRPAGEILSCQRACSRTSSGSSPRPRRMLWRSPTSSAASSPPVSRPPGSRANDTHRSIAPHSTFYPPARCRASHGCRPPTRPGIRTPTRKVPPDRRRSGTLARAVASGVLSGNHRCQHSSAVPHGHTAQPLPAYGRTAYIDRQIARADAQRLEQASVHIKTYVDQAVAHDAARPTTATATKFSDLHDAIDVIVELFQKYAQILTGSALGDRARSPGRLAGDLSATVDRAMSMYEADWFAFRESHQPDAYRGGDRGGARGRRQGCSGLA